MLELFDHYILAQYDCQCGMTVTLRWDEKIYGIDISHAGDFVNRYTFSRMRVGRSSPADRVAQYIITRFNMEVADTAMGTPECRLGK